MLLPISLTFNLWVSIIILFMVHVFMFSWYRDRRDAKRRRPGDENYDSRTLYLSPDFMRSLSDGQVIIAKVVGCNSIYMFHAINMII